MSVIHDLLSVINTYSGVLTLLAITFGPRVLHYLVAWRSRPRSPSIPTVPLPLLGKTLLLLHTAWSLLYLLAPPYSLFASLPISASNAILRASLLRALRAPELGTLHDHLLDRLKSFDNRLAYLRYGHEPLFGCGWCLKPDDYLIYGLAGWMKGYVLEGFILGSLSFGFFGGPESGRRAEQWRSVFAWGLVLGFAGEMAVRWGWELRVVDGDCVKLDRNMYIARNVLFLLVPVVYAYLPLRSTPLDPAVLVPHLSNAQSSLRLTSLARSAIARDPQLRAIWSANGELEAVGAEAGRDAMKGSVQDLSAMEANASRWVKDGWRGMIRVEDKGRPPDTT